MRKVAAIAWAVLASVALISSASAESVARGKCVARVFSRKASYVLRIPGQDMFVVAGVHEQELARGRYRSGFPKRG